MARELDRHLRARPLGARFSARGVSIGGVLAPSLPAAPNIAGLYLAGVGINKVADDIGQWDDQSGNGNHMTQAGATTLKPQDLVDTAGNPGVVFLDTRAGWLDIPSSLDIDARACSFFVVGSRSVDLAGGGYDSQSYLIGFGAVSGDIGMQHGQGVGNFFQGFDGAEKATTIINQNMHCLYGMVSGASESRVYQNGQDEATSPQVDADTSNAGGRLGNHGSVLSLEWRGTIRAVVVYNKALSAAEVLAVKAWAQHFYDAGNSNAIQLAFHGDSLTSGTGPVNTEDNYPNQIGRLRSWDFDGVNAGFPGIGRAQLITEAVVDIDPAFDATEYPTAQICVVWVGTNDLALGTAAALILTDLMTYAAARRAAGWTVLFCTVTPQSGITGGEETARISLNSSIVTNSGAWHDGSIDLAADSRLADSTDPVHFNADQVHLTEVGYGVVASLVNAGLGV